VEQLTHSRRLYQWLFASVPAAVSLLLQVHFVLAWRSFYSPTGLEPPSFMTSTRSLLVGVIAFFLIPLAALWFRRGPRRDALVVMWVGAMVANLAIVLVSPGHGGNLLVPGVVLMGFVIAMPLLVGTLVQALVEEGVRYVRNRHAPEAQNRAV